MNLADMKEFNLFIRGTLTTVLEELFYMNLQDIVIIILSPRKNINY